MSTNFLPEKLDFKSVKKVVFTSDFLRIDDTYQDRLVNPQGMNVAWVYNLIWPKIARYAEKCGIQLESEQILGDEGGWQSLRVNTYQNLALEMNASNWAKFYAGKQYYDDLVRGITGFDSDTLVIGYELPPYLIRYFNESQIPYIDLNIHPIKFLPDYMFGIRSNVSQIVDWLSLLTVPEDFVYEHADILRSKSARQNDIDVIAKSVLYLGQVTVDSSLIFQDRIVGFEDLEASLISLCMNNETVYYKKHPYLDKDSEKPIRALVGKIRNCHWLEANVYDAFSVDNITAVAAMSSGALVEARYFGKSVIKLLEEKDKGIGNGGYSPIYEYPLTTRFWDDLLAGNMSNVGSYAYQYQGELLKSSLNIIWGK